MATSPTPAHPSVAIVGGGWAGLACALKLARAGFKPVVFESAKEPGGRARRALVEGHYRDNGQHLMLSGCTALNTLLELAHIELPVVPFHYISGTRNLRIPTNGHRLHLAMALIGAHGFSWHERYRLLTALLRLQTQRWQVAKGQTVADWLKATRQPASLIHEFWAPLSLAILNTPLEKASLRRLVPVLRDTLGMGASALSIYQPRTNLSDDIVLPIVKAIEQSGGAIHCRQRVNAIQKADSGYMITLEDQNAARCFDQVVLTVPPWSLEHISLPTAVNATGLAQAFGHQPIATIYLGFETDFRLPAPLVQIDGPTSDDARVWAIDRAHCGEPGVIAISVSAEGPWHTLTADELAAASLAALQNAVGPTPPCLWQKAVVIQRATYAATAEASVALIHLEPLPHLHLAGDWTHPEYPATLEAAVYSGFSAAQKIICQTT